MIFRGLVPLALVGLVLPREPDIGYGRHDSLFDLCVGRMGAEDAPACQSLTQRIEEMKRELQAARTARDAAATPVQTP